jgi:cytochrome c
MRPTIKSFMFFLAFPLVVHAEGSAAKGKKAFVLQCATCHKITDQATPNGPGLQGVVGRKAGTGSGFEYTDAMKNSNVTWNDEALDAYLTNPKTFLPGTRMEFTVAKPEARADLIAYLKTLQKPTS